MPVTTRVADSKCATGHKPSFLSGHGSCLGDGYDNLRAHL